MYFFPDHYGSLKGGKAIIYFAHCALSTCDTVMATDQLLAIARVHKSIDYILL